jgi:hypothetical protein
MGGGIVCVQQQHQQQQQAGIDHVIAGGPATGCMAAVVGSQS